MVNTRAMLFTGAVTVPTPGSESAICRGCVLAVLRRHESFRTLEMFSGSSLPVPSRQMTRLFSVVLWPCWPSCSTVRPSR
jgi:hypothetical protein